VLVLISTYLLLVFMVPVLASAIVTFRALPCTTACPHCTRDTALLRARGGAPGRRLLRALRLQRRWCITCGWLGITRRTVATVAVTASEGALEPGFVQVLDVRSLRLDGRTWRVQLQCWREAAWCHGRIVFVDASGRPWPDALQAFSAGTQLEVLGQALSIPDGTLASRLRQLITAE
jgi:hypothetical protein